MGQLDRVQQKRIPAEPIDKYSLKKRFCFLFLTACRINKYDNTHLRRVTPGEKLPWTTLKFEGEMSSSTQQTNKNSTEKRFKCLTSTLPDHFLKQGHVGPQRFSIGCFQNAHGR